MTANRIDRDDKPASQVKDAPDLALATYLDSMLHEATLKQVQQADAAESALVEEVVQASIEEQKPSFKGRSLDEIKQEARQRKSNRSEQKAPDAVPNITEVAAQQPEIELVADAQPEQIKQPEWKPGTIPEWAEEQFDCLMFEVDGLVLGVPMILLGTLYPVDSELTPLFDQADWFKGIMRSADDRNIRVVDTAALVMPDKYDKENIEDYNFAIGIFGTEWAMGAHRIIGSKLIPSGQVKWRTIRSTRAWLAGTIKEEMCAIVDPDAFVNLLLERKPVKISK